MQESTESLAATDVAAVRKFRQVCRLGLHSISNTAERITSAVENLRECWRGVKTDPRLLLTRLNCFFDTTERERNIDWPAFAQSYGTQFARTIR